VLSLRASYIYRTGNADVPGTADAILSIASPYFMSKVKSKRNCFYKSTLYNLLMRAGEVPLLDSSQQPTSAAHLFLWQAFQSFL
jgi:hypothetical protein